MPKHEPKPKKDGKVSYFRIVDFVSKHSIDVALTNEGATLFGQGLRNEGNILRFVWKVCPIVTHNYRVKHGVNAPERDATGKTSALIVARGYFADLARSWRRDQKRALYRETISAAKRLNSTAYKAPLLADPLKQLAQDWRAEANGNWNHGGAGMQKLSSVPKSKTTSYRHKIDGMKQEVLPETAIAPPPIYPAFVETPANKQGKVFPVKAGVAEYNRKRALANIQKKYCDLNKTI